MENMLLPKICELLVRGYTRADMPAALAVPDDITFLESYATALLKIADSAERDTEMQRQLGIARLNMLYAKSLQREDFAQCLAAQKEINLLLALRREPATEPLPDLSSGYTP